MSYVQLKNGIPQGDIVLEPCLPEDVPDNLSSVPAENGWLVAAHSETGHHHAVRDGLGRLLRGDDDPWTCYLEVTAEYADLVNLRPVNPHETVRLPKGWVKIRRKTEYTPAGLRAVQD